MQERHDEWDRVRESTDDAVNAALDLEIAERVRLVQTAGPQAVALRIRELDREWDIEQVLELNASVIAMSGVLLGFRDRRFLALPVVVLSFLMQHAIQGWCPPLPIFRRLGVRTRKEIDREKYALIAATQQ